MAYENGVSTKKTILNACVQLFLQKGFHETSYDDICDLAHVNRGSIYYHFKEKNNIRYEVLWELITKNRKYLQQHNIQDVNDILLAVYMLWIQFFKDPGVRKFQLDYYHDQPTYSPKNELGHFFLLFYNNVYASVWEWDKIPSLDFAAAYGYIFGLMQLAAEDPEKYDALTIFQRCFFTCAGMWGIPKAITSNYWNTVEKAVSEIPEEDVLLLLKSW